MLAVMHVVFFGLCCDMKNVYVPQNGLRFFGHIVFVMSSPMFC